MKIATFIINMPWAETTSALISGLCFSPSPPDIGNYFLSDQTLKDLNLVPNKLIRIKFPPQSENEGDVLSVSPWLFAMTKG